MIGSFKYLIILVAIFSSFCLSEAAVVPTNILQRVLNVRVGTSTGTAFTIEVDGRQYLITAKHVLESSSSLTQIDIFHNDAWVMLPCKRIALEPETVDIAVLAFDQQITKILPIQVGIKGTYVSQEVFFVGFPYGLSIDGRELNAGFPLPFVKHGIVSAFGKRGEPFIVDAINNLGFSGGPIVRPDSATNPTIIGVVSGYRWTPESVFIKDQRTELSIQANTGLLIAYDIDYAIEAIKKNPIGWRVQLPP